MNPLASLVNGHAQSLMAVTSRLQYGDGLFETVAIHDGRLLLWREHIRRLMAGIERLGLSPIDAALLTAEAETLAATQSLAILKIIVVRGSEIEFCVGAGIVADSDPKRELRETQAKAAGLVRALGIAGRG